MLAKSLILQLKGFAVATIFAIPAISLAQIAASDPVAIIQKAQKAVGGNAFFEPAPYKLTYTRKISDPSNNYYKTIEGHYSYKNSKSFEELNVSITEKGKQFKPFKAKNISDYENKTAWESQSVKANAKWIKIPLNQARLIPCYNANTLNDLLFDATKEPAIINIDGVEYYQLHGIRQKPTAKDWQLVCIVNTKNNLIHKIIYENTKISFKQTDTFTNYANFQGVMIPQKILTEILSDTNKKNDVLITETVIHEFAFSNNIPDSLFVVPGK